LLLNALDEEVQRRLEIGAAADLDVLQVRYPGVVPDVIRAVLAYRQKNIGTQTHQRPANVGDIRVPGYEILGELGRGGMGVVFRAVQVKANRPVALKMVLPSALAGEHDRERFRAEARAVAKLQHANIVQVFEVGEHDGRPYFALEFCDGGSLSSRLAGTPLPGDVAADLVEQLADAMNHAHEQGIIHRDLKPANVLLTKSPVRAAKSDTRNDRGRSTRRDGSRSRGKESKSCGPTGTAPRSSGVEAAFNMFEFVAKVTDFGLAKQLEGESAHTHTGAVMGTPSYMSPEQASGESKRVTPEADVYALGAILYECLTGRAPFKGATVAETLDQVRHREPPPPTALNPNVPRDLETICLKCLQKEPQKRYPTAGELADDLRRFLDERPIRARPAGFVERAVKWGRRRPTAATFLCSGIVAVLMLLGLGAFAGIKWEAAVAEQQRRALVQVDALQDAAPAAVPNILSNLAQDRAIVLPHLRTKYTEQTDPTKKARLALALLPVEPENVRSVVVNHLLQADDPAEVVSARDALAENAQGNDLVEKLWRLSEDANAPDSERFRAMVGLAAFAPEDRRWPSAAPRLIEELLAQNSNPLFLGTWVEALYPIRSALIESLGKQFRDRNSENTDRHLVAAQVLQKYVKDQPEALFELILDADAKQYELLRPLLAVHRVRAISRMKAELEKQPDYWNSAPLNTTWKPLPPTLMEEFEKASGLVSERWALCQDLPLDRLQAVTELLRESGYRPLTVRPWGSAEGADSRVAIVWTRDDGDWKLEANLSSEQLRQRDGYWRNTGFIATDVAGYRTKEGTRFAGLWRRSVGKEEGAFYAGVLLSRHREEGDKLTKAGYHPTHIQITKGSGGVPLYSVTWIRGHTKVESWNLRVEEQGVHDRLVRDQASLLLDVQLAPSRPSESTTWYASVWHNTSDHEGIELHGLTVLDQRKRWTELQAANFHPVTLSLHQLSNEKLPRAASVWHRPIVTHARETLARRQATAAVILLTLGQPANVWPLLGHATDPTRRSYIVWRAGQLRADPNLLVDQLHNTKDDVAARRCLILALGEYSDKELPAQVRKPLVENLLAWYRDDPDPGVHSAISWLLRHKVEGPTPRLLDWGQGEELRRIDVALAVQQGQRQAVAVGRISLAPLPMAGLWTSLPGAEDLAGRDWYVNGQGQTMAVIKGPVKFRMGSPLWEPYRSLAEEKATAENRQVRFINRSYAIATTSVTVEQWRRFLESSPAVPNKIPKRYSPDPTCPTLNVSWFAAASYCNWLSAKEGIPPDQWCYPTEIREGTTPFPDYLHRAGYRLPTEAEWEYACRAGSESPRHFGSADELLPRYAHFLANSQDRTWPVGQKRPNDFGLFDVHGNIFNWCDDRERSVGERRPEIDAEDLTAFSIKHRRTMRGGYFGVRPSVLRSAFSYCDQPTNQDAYGLRVCRTIYP